MALTMQDADAVASRVEALIQENRYQEASHLLDPLASGRTKFPILDRVGARLGQSTLRMAHILRALDDMISHESVGYYVIAGSALKERLRVNMVTCLKKTAEYIVVGDHWAKCDSLAERVWGAALVEDFSKAYTFLEKMVNHDNRWIRRRVPWCAHTHTQIYSS